jgi:tetratricopeptide (TPR) repeat protein
MGHYREAIEYNQQAIQVAQKIGNRQAEGVSLGSLGNTYTAISRYQEAIDLSA